MFVTQIINATSQGSVTFTSVAPMPRTKHLAWWGPSLAPQTLAELWVRHHREYDHG